MTTNKGDTDLTAQDNFVSAFRRALLLKSAIGLLTISIILVLTCILPLSYKLKNEQVNRLLSVAESRKATVELFLEKAIETAKQITSRTQVRRMLEKYNRQEVSLAELADFTRPKLNDAISLSGNAVGVSRFDAQHTLVVATGIPVPPTLWCFPTDQQDFLIRGLEKIDGKLYLIVSAPILTSDKQRVGTDIILFAPEKIAEIINDTEGYGKTGEMVLGRLAQGEAESYFRGGERNHPARETAASRQKELTRAFATVAKADEKTLPWLFHEGITLKVGDRIKYTNWVILCCIDKHELYAPVNTIILYLVFCITILLLVGMGGMKHLLLPLADKAIIHTEKLQQEIHEKEEALNRSRQAENALIEKEKKYRTLIDQATDAIYVTDMKANFIDVNKRACESLNYSRKELLTLTISDVDPNFKTADHAQKVWDKLLDGKTIKLESSHQRKDGSSFPVEIHIGKLEINGQPAILGIARDISDRKLAAEKIKKHQQFLQNVLNALSHPFCVIDAGDYTVKLANKAFNFDEDHKKTKCYQITHGRSEPCCSDTHPCPLDLVKKTKQPVVVEHLHIDQAGTEQPVEVHAYPVFDADNNLTQIIEYCLDISERKRVEEERRRLVTAIEQGADCIVITDEKGTIQYVNPSFEQHTGYSREEVIGKNPRILQSGIHPAAFYRGMWETLTRGKAWQGHLINKKKDGSLFEEEASITPVMDAAGKIINYVAVKRDVTDQIKIEQQLRQAQKMEAMGTLAGGIAHDFNNLLAPILGYSELALSRLSPGDPLISNLQQITRAAERARDLVQQILAFSRKAPAEIKPFQPHLVVKEVLKLLRASLPSTIAIKTNIPSDCGAILADPTQVHQIIMNLCTNAYHAMRETGGVLGVRLKKVTVKAGDRESDLEVAPGDYVLFEVSDTGCGIDPGTAPRIFEPYFTTKNKGEGTGLGLSVVHGIVESHQGHIAVSSEPGKGTRFRVYLPRIVETLAVDENANQEPIPTGTEHVLVVDDEDMVSTLLQRMLEELGYRVSRFDNSLRALTFIKQDTTAFDVLITDMTMPNLTGLELAQKALAIRQNLPVILCTGYSELISKEQAQAAGIRGYLMKPVAMRELGKLIRKVLA